MKQLATINELARRAVRIIACAFVACTLTYTSFSATTRYVLSTNVVELQDLGSLISVNTLDKHMMFSDPNTSQIHLMLYYIVEDITTYPIQVFDINLSNSTCRLVDGVLGRSGPYGTVLHPNGKIYLATNDPGYLMEYDPVTGGVRQISKLHPTLRRDAQMTVVGSDNKIYIGEYNPLGGGALGSYDPATDTFTDIGVLDASFSSPQWAYTLAADTRYVYVGLGQSPWYLAIHDTVGQTNTMHFRDASDSGGSVYRGVGGTNYYWRSTVSGDKWYVLQNGVPTETFNTPQVAYHWVEHDGVVLDSGSYSNRFGTEIDLGEVYPDNVNNVATVRWRTGGTNWNTIQTNGFRLQPATVKRLAVRRNDQMVGFTSFYGPVFTYNPITSQTTVLGRPQFSLYDLLFTPESIYFSGYTAATLRYNPSSTWNLTASTIDNTSIDTNPRKIPLQMGKYHYYSAISLDGTIFVAANHERDSTGGEVGWYEPDTGATDSLREPFVDTHPTDLISAAGGEKIIYASATNGLFIVDASTKVVDRNIPLTAVSGLTSMDKVVEVSRGIVFGASGTNIFTIDLNDGDRVLLNQTISGQAFGGSSVSQADRRLVLGPDQMVWMFVGGSLCRIDPLSGSVESITNTTAKSLVFQGGDLYLYGSENLGVIRNLLVYSPQTTANSATAGRVLVR